jgi:hypothetical protein
VNSEWDKLLRTKSLWSNATTTNWKEKIQMSTDRLMTTTNRGSNIRNTKMTMSNADVIFIYWWTFFVHKCWRDILKNSVRMMLLENNNGQHCKDFFEAATVDFIPTANWFENCCEQTEFNVLMIRHDDAEASDESSVWLDRQSDDYDVVVCVRDKVDDNFDLMFPVELEQFGAADVTASGDLLEAKVGVLLNGARDDNILCDTGQRDVLSLTVSTVDSVYRSAIHRVNMTATLLEKNDCLSSEQCLRLIDVRFLFAMDQFEKGTVFIFSCPACDVVTDDLTEPLQSLKLKEYLRGVRPMKPG